ncbi:MAG: peptide/nickel transport system permease protein [Planctomycetota bacterium]|jgi:peptide/nickel transport system permease protein
MIPTTFGIALVVFLLYQAAPGDPATVMLGISGGGELGTDSDLEARVDSFKRRYGLDRSLVVQFLHYVGPFNLSRDGHPWFTTPATERKTDVVTLESGGEVIEGSPLAIPELSDTAPQVSEDILAASYVLVDDAADAAAHSAAHAMLVAHREAALPAVFSRLFELRNSMETRAPAIERLFSFLEKFNGEVVKHNEARGLQGQLRAWFGWYYTGEGERLRNSGDDPWGGLLVFDLGEEMYRKTPVGAELIDRLKLTVPLSLISVLLSYLVALPMGIFSVRRQGTKADAAATLWLFVLFSIPTFWAGLMLIIAFGVMGLDLLPVIGLYSTDHEQMSWFGQMWDMVKHCILPVITMSYGSLAYLSRQMRAGMLEVIRQDYIRTARAKGLSENVVIYKHALRNSVIPIITLFASILPILVGGSIIVETVFDLPGMGKYAFEGLLRRDFNIVMATTIFVGIMTQLGILVSDIVYSLVDPRIRFA